MSSIKITKRPAYLCKGARASPIFAAYQSHCAMLWFKKKNTVQITIEEDICWLSKQEKYAGIARHALQMHAQKQAVMVGAFGLSAYSSMEAALKRQVAGDEIPLFAAGQLTGNAALKNYARSCSSRSITILMCEHARSNQERQALIDSLQYMISVPCTLVFCIALDDPILHEMDVTRLKSLLQSLGMKEHESLSHPFITKAVTRMLKKSDAFVPST